MLWFHAFEWSAFWVFAVIGLLVVIDLVGSYNDRLEPTAIGFFGTLLAFHLFGVFDVASAVYHHWGYVLIGFVVWLAIGLLWMVLKYKWFLREEMRDAVKHYDSESTRKLAAEDLSYEKHLSKLVSWWVFWLPNVFVTFTVNLWETLKFFIVEVCGRWLKAMWQREVDRFLKEPPK